MSHCNHDFREGHYCAHCNTFDQDVAQEMAERIVDLENQLASGVHTCSNQCQRPMCVLRRENQELREQVEELQGKVDRYEKALTPSLETKRAYWGGDSTRCLPWVDIKALMVLIRCHYAALQGKGDGE